MHAEARPRARLLEGINVVFLLIALLSVAVIVYGLHNRREVARISSTLEQRTLPLLEFRRHVLEMRCWLTAAAGRRSPQLARRALARAGRSERAARAVLGDQIYDHSLPTPRHNRLVELQRRALQDCYARGRLAARAFRADDPAAAHRHQEAFLARADALCAEADELVGLEKRDLDARLGRLYRRTDRMLWLTAIALAALVAVGSLARYIRRRYTAALREEIARREDAQSESRRRAGELRESQGFLHGVLDGIQDGLSVLDTDLTIRFTNTVMERWYAASMPLVGRKCNLCYQGSDTPCNPCPTLRCLETGRTEREVVRGPPGSPAQWIELFSYPLHDDESGKVTGVVEFVRDITEGRRAEHDLHESRNLLQATLDAIPDVIGIQDRDRTIIKYNAAGYAFLGLGPEETHGRKCYELIGLDAPCERCATAECYRTKRPAELTKYVPQLDRWLECRSYPVLDEGGRVGRVIEHLRDVTERRQLEERLRHTEKMEAIGQLAGGIAHDFNNQLAGILGFAELLLRRLEDPALREHAERIAASARRSAELTGQLLAFARKAPFRREPVDLHAVVANALAILEHSLDKRIAVDRRLEAAPAVVHGDPGRMEAMLLNLALNARDAMPDGGRLTIATRNEALTEGTARAFSPSPAPGNYVLLEVADTGCGMSAQTRMHIFEPFFTTKEVDTGTGMGLAAVHGTVVQHGGAIAVESTPGRGSTFRIYLPCADGPAAPPAHPAQSVPAARAATILVVDDEGVCRLLAEEVLGHLGYTVHTAEDGERAIAFFREHWRAVDLVVLDMLMPRMNGGQTFAALKEIDPEVRVLVATGYSAEEEAGDLLAAGAADFVQKPFQIAEFSRKVAAVLGHGPD